jgi:hypothetical protein
MRFFIGALALLVIVAVLASPAALGWVQLADIREITAPSATDPALAPAAEPAKQ